MHCQPWGLDGGHSGMGNQVKIKLQDKHEDTFPNAKVLMKRLNKGDTFTLLTGGGGGFGTPDTRNPELVAKDVKQGYISLNAANNIYKVKLDKHGNVNIAETNELRK
jgi:N-methylhydantoinase B